MTDKQLAKFAQLWEQWACLHASAAQAFSLVVNIHGRLQDLQADPAAFPLLQQQQQHQQHQQQQPPIDPVGGQPASALDLQQVVIAKQLASLDRALSNIRAQHEQLQLVVRDLQRLYVDAAKGISPAGRALNAAAAVPQGPELSPLQLVEALLETWVMCRDELLLKTALLGLVQLDATPQHMATLLQCYKDQPNIRQDSIEATLSIIKQTRLARQDPR